MLDVIEESLVDVDRDDFGRLLGNWESKVAGAGADVGYGLPGKRPQVCNDLFRLLPFRARGILEASHQLVEVRLVHVLVCRALLRIDGGHWLQASVRDESRRGD